MTLESFNNKTNSEEKGGEKVMNKFEELLAKYGKTVDEVTFEYESLSEEELEVAFKEAFEETEGDNEVTVEETVVEETVEEPVDEGAAEDVVEETAEVVVEESVEEIVETEEKFVLKYELSHDDIRSALYSLLAATSEDGYYYTWIIEVYDDKFIYQDYMEDKFYRQDYSKDGETVSLGENKVEVFNEWLSKAEKEALDALKADYAALKAFKDNYDAAELKIQKDEIFARDEYSVIADDEAFKALVSDAEKFSVDEIDSKAKAIFADHIIKVGTFSANNEELKKTKTIGLNFNKKEKKPGPYGNLFKKD
jgi:hypothetical protein